MYLCITEILYIHYTEINIITEHKQIKSPTYAQNMYLFAIKTNKQKLYSEIQMTACILLKLISTCEPFQSLLPNCI